MVIKLGAMYEGTFVVTLTLLNAVAVSLFVRLSFKTVWVFALACGAINGMLMFAVFVAQRFGMPMLLGMLIAAVAPRPTLWLADKVLQRRID